MPDKEYKVRADYLSKQYWSEVFLWTDQTISVQEGTAEVAVTNMGLPLDNIATYVFNESGTYLGIHDVTAGDGSANFRLPQGTYNFRADYLSNQYWSDSPTVIPHVSNPVPITTGGGEAVFTLQGAPGEPLVGIKSYLFNDTGVYFGESSVSNEDGEVNFHLAGDLFADVAVYVFNEAGGYLGINGHTDELGQVAFDLADGTYTFRADYLGYQFWTGVASVPQSLNDTLTIENQDAVITVNAFDGITSAPLESIRTYLFTAGGSYLGQS